MCDISDISYDVVRPDTPIPDPSRKLRRTISYASIDTILPPGGKGVRRRLTEIAENLTKKKKKHSSTHDNSKSATRGRTFDPKASSRGREKEKEKEKKRGRKAAAALRDTLCRSDEESALAIADRLHSSIPSELDDPLMLVHCEPDKASAKEDEDPRHNGTFPVLNLGPGINIRDTSVAVLKAGIKDVELDIRASESDVTFWDGLQASHHVFKCKLYLRCTTHLYDRVYLPGAPIIEMDCNTRPAGSRYAKPVALQTTYKGATPGLLIDSNGLPKVTLSDGIHIDRFWRTVKDDDGTWGWYREAFVPLSPRLFDKADYREFKLVGRVWLGESCLEAELAFGISMLLRELDMN